MFNIQIGYPEEDDEVTVINRTTSTQIGTVEKVVDGAEIAAMANKYRRYKRGYG